MNPPSAGPALIADGAKQESLPPGVEKIPFWRKVAFGLGGPVNEIAVFVPNQNLTPVFNLGMGIDPAALGILLMLWRIWDAFADLFIGNFSDHAQTRWGRRRPFIVLGAILTGITMPLIWWVPGGLSSGHVLIWLGLAGVVFYSCFSLWAMPYNSLQLEMTPNYDERTNITAFRSFFQLLFSLGSGWILALATLPIFGVTAAGSPNLPLGMRYLSIFLGLLTVVIGILPGIFVPERRLAALVRTKPDGLIRNLRQTLARKPFLYLLLTVFAKTFGFGLVSTLGFYVNAFYVCQGNVALAAKIQGVKVTLLFLPNLFAIPLFTWFARRYDKRALLYLTIAANVIGCLLMLPLYDPAHPWLQVIPAIFIGPVNLGLTMIIPSMQADIADLDELICGQRREGSFSAVFSWIYKGSMTLTVGLSGILLSAVGFHASAGRHQPPEMLQTLKQLYVWVPIGFSLLGIYAVSRYDLDRSAMGKIRLELESRRGVA